MANIAMTVDFEADVDEDDVDLSPFEEDEKDKMRRNLIADFATPLKPQKQTDIQGDHMQVYLRVRPFTSQEVQDGEAQECLKLSNNQVTACAPKDSVTFKNSQHGSGKAIHKFTFSSIFHETTTQKDFFDKSMMQTVKDFIAGQNCLVFTYGVTNSGKTYTIQGHNNEAGILPRALDVLFNSIDGKQWTDATLKPRMFCDVVRLNSKQEETEYKIKENVLKMASEEGASDMVSMLGDVTQLSDMSVCTTSTTMSEDSLMTSKLVDASMMDKFPSEDDIDRVLDEAVERVREDQSISLEEQGQIKFSVWVTFAEVYNENIYDLLEPLPKTRNARRVALQLREDKNGSPYIKGLKHIHVMDADEAYRILTIGKKNLQMACTKLNHCSSRSHCIFSIKVLRVVDKEQPQMARVSMLSLCDLAGSERYGKSQTTGDRLKEAGNINTSLLTLGRCIKALRYNQEHKTNPQVVPFRESKLTRLFQGFFCGKGKASMIVNVNQCASLFDETLHALKFSAIAQKVVVMQEAEKPKKMMRPAREASLALVAATPGMLTRHSIAWATPNAQLKALEDDAVNLPIPEDEVWESSEDERTQELLTIIQDLQTAVAEANNKNAMMEVRIREEVCAEMAQQLVEIEQSYGERLREEHLLAEEKAERKVELYTMSVMKNRKRARIEKPEDEDEELVKLSLLRDEQASVKRLEGELADHAAEISELKQRLSAMQASQKQASQQMALNTKLQFEIADMKMEIDRLRVEGEKSVTVNAAKISKKQPADGSSVAGDIEQTELIQSLSDQLQQAQQLISAKDAEVKDLTEMLTEAGETFTQTEGEMTQLKQVISEHEDKMTLQSRSVAELQQVVDESQAVIAELNSQIVSKDVAVVDLQKEIVALKENDSHSADNMKISKLQATVEEHKSVLADNEVFVAELNEKLRAKEKQLESVENQNAELKKKLEDETNDSVDNLARMAALRETIQSLESKLQASEALLKSKVQEMTTNDNDALSSLQVTLNEALQREDQLKKTSHASQATVDELQVKVGSLEVSLESFRAFEAEATQLRDQLTNAQDEKHNLTDQLHAKSQQLDHMTQEHEKRTTESETRVAALEESLHAANQEVRQATMQLEVKVAECQQAQQLAQENQDAVATMTRQMEDQETVLDECRYEFEQVKSKAQDTATVVQQLQCKLEIARQGEFDAVELNTELESKVERLDAELEAAREKQSCQKQDIANHEQRTNELQAAVARLGDSLAEANKTVKAHKELSNRHETTSSELQRVTSELDKSKACVTCLQDRVSRLEASLADAREHADDSKQLHLVQSQLSQLETQLGEKQQELSQTLSAKKQTDAKLHTAESALCQLKEELQASEDKRRRLADDVASSSGDVKRLEALLREGESRVEELQTELSQEKMNESRLEDSYNKLNETLSERKQKVCNLEDVVRELRDCLRSSKESEAHTDKLLKESKQKQRHLEDEVIAREDRIAALEQQLDDEQRDLQAESRIVTQCTDKLATQEQEMRDYQDNLKQLQEKNQHLADCEDRIAELEQELHHNQRLQEVLQDEHSHHNAELVEKVAALERELEDKQQCMQELQDKDADTTELRRRVEQGEETQSKLQDAETQIQTLEAQLAERQRALDDEVASNKTRISQLEKELESSCDAVRGLEERSRGAEQLERDVESREAEMRELRRERDELQEELANSKRAKAAQDQEKDGRIQDLRKQLQDMEACAEELRKDKDTQVLSRDDEIATLRLAEEERRVEVDRLTAAVADRDAQLGRKDGQVTQLRETMKEKEAAVEALEKRISDKDAAIERDQERLSELVQLQERLTTQTAALEEQRREVCSLRESLAEKTGVAAETSQRMQRLEGSVDELTREADQLRQSVAEKEKKMHELEQLQTLSQEITSTLREELAGKQQETDDLRTELDAKQQDVLKYMELSGQHSSASRELTLLNQELSKAREKESKLRSQFAEASERMKAENEKFIEVEDKLRTAEDNAFQSNVKVTELQAQLHQIQNEKQEQQSEFDKTKKQSRELDDKVKHLEELVERKESRIKTKNSSINDLMSKLEEERKGYQVALQDASANEKIIESLKSALEEQEGTMEQQDVVLKRREDENEALVKELDTLSDKYKELLSTSQGSSTTNRRLQQQMDSMTSKLEVNERSHKQTQATLEARLQTLEAELEEVRRERGELRTQLTTTRAELQTLDTLLTESRRQTEYVQSQQQAILASRIEEVRKESQESGSALIKQKFQILEDKCREQEHKILKMQVLEEKCESLDKQLGHLKKEKQKLVGENETKLEEFRKNRDQLVQGLEQILLKKDAEIIHLKAKTSQHETVSKSEADHHGNDDDHLVPPPASSRGRKLKNMEKEIENLKKQLETESQQSREFARRLSCAHQARDEVITQLRDANLALQARVALWQDQNQEAVVEPVVETQKTRRTTRGRRKQSDTSESSMGEEVAPPSRPRRSSRATTASTRRRKASSALMDDENERPHPDIDVMTIQEEDGIDLDQFPSAAAPPRTSRRAALSSLSETSANSALLKAESPSKDALPSTPVMKESLTAKSPPTTGRRKRRLLATSDQVMQPPFDITPHTNIAEVKSEPAHEIVTRKLRRTRKN